ncbi:septal ring lytic transglycosylase RlpA family protein [Agrilutibacter solisilvae]|uniref:Endolytic peptidoglycan transglycosylase RlpA n=1 Tax=Agrilutibacter solisilvae TaxID=2763317 RepID=A0A974Y003_9GAMM|nr:septal ring lytic transglycosylase RlpA family protein [Lysobacter solisilvae]QSX78748.1 septal ring lytic transglycosylase RlpA family protein [Lysobacter solisilvae]
MKALLAMMLALGLTACAGAPPRASAPPPAAKSSASPAAAAAGRKVSPYAPAQEDHSKRGNYVAGGLYAPGERDSVPGELPDVDAIPEPEVTDEPRSAVGNRKSYTVLGKRYQVMDSARDFVETGTASFYGNKFHGRRTSNMEVYDMYTFSAAHKTLPLPSFARVTNLDNGKSVVVRVNDRGPFHPGRVIDLSYAAAAKLGYVSKGTARVEVRALTPGETEPTFASARNNPPPAPRTAAPAAGSAMDKLVAAIPVARAAAADTPGPRTQASDYRFDMRQDGRTMTADEFEAWMKKRRVRVATGKPGTPDVRADASTDATPDDRTVALPVPVAAAPANGAPSTPAVGAVQTGEAVTLQVAAFSARANADRALAMLQGAGIGQARLHDVDSNGQKVWRLRVGPLAADQAPELAARIRGLGFGPPQRVRE